MTDLDQRIERVARAFYGVDDDEQTWDLASEDLKQDFRRLAAEAIAMAGFRERSPAARETVSA